MAALPKLFSMCILCLKTLSSVSASTTTSNLGTSGNSSENVHTLDFSLTTRDLVLGVTDFTCGVCNGSLSQEQDVCTFKCKQCMCDDLCHFYGDCCPDLLFKDADFPVLQPNPYLICSENRWTTWHESPNIFMVGKCPPNSDTSNVQKCNLPDITNQRQATPVSDPKSNVTYRNSFCAQCHGVTEYEIWRHEVKCSLWSSIQLASSKSDLWRIAVDDGACDIVTKPPSLGMIRNCYPVEYNTCNGTGNAKESPEPVVQRLCETYSYPVDYYESNLYYASYRNIFCALCDGAVLNRQTSCFPGNLAQGQGVPLPLNILLNFIEDYETEEHQPECKIGQVFDPLLKSCRNISCPLRRVLVGNKCEEIFSIASGLGIAIDVFLQPIQTSKKIPLVSFLDQYLVYINTSLVSFSPYIISEAEQIFFSSEIGDDFFAAIEMVQVRANIVSLTTCSLLELESAIMDAMQNNFTLTTKHDNITLSSTPILCPRPCNAPDRYRRLPIPALSLLTRFGDLDPGCYDHDCRNAVKFERVQMNCPFLQYNITQVDFTFNAENKSLFVGDQIVYLKPFTFLLCGDLLKMCVGALEEIESILSPVADENFALSMVSLICNCLSLIGLALTFAVYVILSKLRTLPGLNTMALVFNLFLAQLFFLTTSNRTSNFVLCQIFGVLIHYFWLSSFTWMFMSAYHMYTVFTRLRAYGNSGNDIRHFLKYCLISNLSPMVVVGSCLAMYVIPSQGMESGYGGRLCFLNNNIAVGVFFAGPLCLMLLLNAFFFTKTVMAIRSVPDMKTSSNRNNKGHVSVYIKLSLLFGFTWTFGILAEIVGSDVLTYIFVILTGSQGLLLFVAYCVNQRCWVMLRQALFSTPSNAGSTVTSQTFISR